MTENIKWLGHAGVRIKGVRVIYIDPYYVSREDINEGGKADIILITHEHYDHCSLADVRNLVKSDTIIITVPGCQSKLSEVFDRIEGIKLVEPGKTVEIKGIKIEAVPAYNINKTFHPRENNWVGFIVNFEGRRIYHAGDTDLIPEMRNIKNIDIAFLPIGGTYTMNIKEAVMAADIIKPKAVIPIHYGSIIGSMSDFEAFKKVCNVPVEKGV